MNLGKLGPVDMEQMELERKGGAAGKSFAATAVSFWRSLVAGEMTRREATTITSSFIAAYVALFKTDDADAEADRGGIDPTRRKRLRQFRFDNGLEEAE